MRFAGDKEAADKAVQLGESGDANALNVLGSFLKHCSPNVRRLAASAIGKLAGKADTAQAVRLLQVCLSDPHPQVRQYSVKALSAYGSSAEPALVDLLDMTQNADETDYNRRDAAKALGIIQEALKNVAEAVTKTCQKCGSDVLPDEEARAQKAFQRVYCDHCFDEVFLTRRNWETQVELHKTIQAKDGTVVQSEGERIITEFLARHSVPYRYDNRFRIIKGYAIRPDFYLPESDLYIEYWGMEDNLDYQIGMLEKKKLYQQAGKRLVSFYGHEKADLPRLLLERLGRYMRLSDDEGWSRAEPESGADSIPRRAASQEKGVR